MTTAITTWARNTGHHIARDSNGSQVTAIVRNSCEFWDVFARGEYLGQWRSMKGAMAAAARYLETH